jgi:hypothetical protein
VSGSVLLFRKELRHSPRKMPPPAYQNPQYVVPRGGISLGKWRSSFAESSEGKMNVQTACALNTLYKEKLQGSRLRGLE